MSERGARSRVPMSIPHGLTLANGVLRPNVSELPCQSVRRPEVVPVAIAASLVHLCNHRHELHLPPSRSRRRNRSQSDQTATYFLLRLRTRSGGRLEGNVPPGVVLVSWHCHSHPPPTTYALPMRRRCLDLKMPCPSWSRPPGLARSLAESGGKRRKAAETGGKYKPPLRLARVSARRRVVARDGRRGTGRAKRAPRSPACGRPRRSPGNGASEASPALAGV